MQNQKTIEQYRKKLIAEWPADTRSDSFKNGFLMGKLYALAWVMGPETNDRFAKPIDLDANFFEPKKDGDT